MMMAILLCWSSQVQAAQSGDYTYTVTDGSAQITKYTGAGGAVTIPSTLAGYPVASIGDSAFSNCIGLTSISFAQGVTSIGDSAFSNCIGLTNISFAQGVTDIGDSAFYNCIGLTSISFLQGVTSIGDSAFSNCIGLTSVSFSQGVTTIGDSAFSHCIGLTNINLPQGVTDIGDSAFSNCTDLTTICFNSTTTSISDSASTLPATITIIGYDPSTAKIYAAKYNRTFEVIGTTNTLQSITITTPATKLSYSTSDKLDITGLVVTGNYSDGSTKVENITAANVTGFNSAVPAKDQVLTVTVSGLTVTYKVQIVAAVIAIPVGTVIFSNGQALDLGYLNKSAHTAEVIQDVISSGGIFIITFTGQVINNSTSAILTDLSILPAVTYKDANGNVKYFAKGGGPEVTTSS
ncbi:MAG: leucine-rich repeat protein [Desulfosporosinus sp.]|nr:leucine-rich repeat protein [Desulfosporosinus sp.]